MGFRDLVKSFSAKPASKPAVNPTRPAANLAKPATRQPASTAARLAELDAAFEQGHTADAMRLIRDLRSAGVPPGPGRLRVDLIEGTLLHQQGRHREALEFLKTVFESDSIELAEQVGFTCMQCLVELQSLREALRVKARLVDMFHKDPLRRAQAFIAGGSVLIRTENLDEARSEFEVAISTLEQAGGAQAKQLLIEAYSGLGDLYLALDDQPAALAVWKQALDLCRAAYGDSHPQTAAILSGVGNLEMVADNLESARRSFEHALEIYKTIGREESVEAAIALNNLAFTLLMQEKLAEAEEAAKSAVRMSDKRNGAVHQRAQELLSKIQTARLVRR